MSLIFPFNPVKNQIYEYNDVYWQYNGNNWVKIEPDINWAWNEGNDGEGVYDYKTGTTIAFKSLVAGSGVSLSSTTTGITINVTGGTGGISYERRSDFVDPYLYCGTAISGSSISASVWDITRVTIDMSGGTFSEYATNVAWTDRYIIIYTP